MILSVPNSIRSGWAYWPTARYAYRRGLRVACFTKLGNARASERGTSNSAVPLFLIKWLFVSVVLMNQTAYDAYYPKGKLPYEIGIILSRRI